MCRIRALQPVFVRTGTSGNFYDGINFRYEPYWQPMEELPAALPLQTVQDGRMGSRLINTNYHDFAPRIGIAYSPSNKWSIRLGYGIFYSMESKNSIFDLARGMGGRATTLATDHLCAADVHLHQLPQHGEPSGDHTRSVSPGARPNTCRTAPPSNLC